ncbi:hypothetical protein GYMLUDRAFT_44166 [Collybiopsis luxurians FD-317 M1]|uniref:Telomere length regulation protein conserved domain-containing protein n=1 Tax=Collybiopsis luxurians FD-317 M1 TaxID=944289 RepID=A0A0D0B855_9AGAR|nr:hypothetical protein GYMLUDRAFT_44166 [Collybiopsis luxurians FD-317 M1]
MNSDSEVRQVIHQLQHPISDYSTLLSLLSAPLHSLSLLPPIFTQYNLSPLPSGSIRTAVHVPLLQRALLEHVLPTWDSGLKDNHNLSLLDQYFCPDSFTFASPAAGDVALLAYSTILSLPFTDHSLRLLTRLSREYPIDRLHTSIFSQKDSVVKLNRTWEDCVQNVVSVPAKVGNYCGTRKLETPPLLEHGTYFNNLSVRCEHLISISTQESLPSINFLLTKLVKLGIFAPYLPSSDSQPSFFRATLPIIRSRLALHNPGSYSASWWQILRGFESSFALQNILVSLFSSLEIPESLTDDSALTRASVKRESLLLCSLCPLKADDVETWQTVSAAILGRDWTENVSRIFVCWLAKCDTSLAALERFLNDAVSLWSDPDHIKRSLISKHRYVSSIILLIISYFPSSSPELISLVHSGNFINGISVYISSMDNTVRHCGMLVAEVAAQRAGKSLDFKDWNGDDSGKPWARSFRKLLMSRDMDAELVLVDLEHSISETEDPIFGAVLEEVPKPSNTILVKSGGYDSDDSISGYASIPSSRSNSPTPSELNEIEKDPSLNVGRKKMAKPVYLAQLGAMIRSSAKDNAAEHADTIEIALDCAEELIRKKKNYGTELEENAINLVYGLVGLQNNYDLDKLQELRQNALNALVACCPKKAAPCIVEEFFKNQYSADQRYAMLNALALGARELASLPVPPSKISQTSTSFPSKRLPAPLHQKYLPSTETLPHILSSITRQAIDRGKETVEDKVPTIVRERRFRIQQPKRITETEFPISNSFSSLPTKQTTLNEVAAEFFIAPMIQRFWLFLRDERTREERSAHNQGRARYHSAGTGLILNTLILTQFLRTLAVLVHASEHAPEWLGFIAPDSLELALTLGTKPMSVAESVDGEGERGTKEASVLAGALELALIVLDGCIQLDGGRSLSLDHTALLMSVSEWSAAVFSRLESGIRLQGAGGDQGASLKRVASGVILKVDEILSKYRRAMIDTW